MIVRLLHPNSWRDTFSYVYDMNKGLSIASVGIGAPSTVGWWMICEIDSLALCSQWGERRLVRGADVL